MHDPMLQSLLSSKKLEKHNQGNARSYGYIYNLGNKNQLYNINHLYKKQLRRCFFYSFNKYHAMDK
jgi:hypothetical protein